MENKSEHQKTPKEAIIDRKKDGFGDFQDLPTPVKEDIEEDLEEQTDDPSRRSPDNEAYLKKAKPTDKVRPGKK